MVDPTTSDPAVPVGQPDDLLNLQELALEHLGLSRPRMGDQANDLQDDLLPAFIETARYAWLAASPYQLPRTTNAPPDQLLSYLTQATEQNGSKIERLEKILDAWGVESLLEELAVSPHASRLAQ